MKSSLLRIGIAAAVIMGAQCGCSASLQITNYPLFFNHENNYRGMAVAPVQNNVEPGRFTDGLSSGLVRRLKENGYYRVADYTQENIGDKQLVDQLFNKQGIDLVTFSTVVGYDEGWDERTERRTEYHTYYEEDEAGNEVEYNEPYEVDYPIYERTTVAYMSVIVIDLKSGEKVYSAVLDGSCSEENEDLNDMSAPQDALWCAFNRTLSEEVFHLSPIRETIRVKPKDTMKIYRVDSPDKWERTTDFSPKDKIAVSFGFPSTARHNYFKFDIVYGDKDTVVASEKIHWEGERKIYYYDIASFLEASGGADTYKIRLWDSYQVAFSREIEVDK